MITASVTNTLITAEITAGEITANVTNNLITAEVGNSTTTYIYGDFSAGVTTGDILRWNNDTQAWEAKSEPLEFTGIILTPSTVALSDVEGGMFYRSTDKSVLVCTSDV